MNIWGPKNRDEKLNCTHNNLVKRGLSSTAATGRGRVGGSISGMTLRSWAWTKCCDVDIPRVAYIPTKTVGTYAPPAVLSRCAALNFLRV
jgi:hypothetical protein